MLSVSGVPLPYHIGGQLTRGYSTRLPLPQTQGTGGTWIPYAFRDATRKSSEDLVSHFTKLLSAMLRSTDYAEYRSFVPHHRDFSRSTSVWNSSYKEVRNH